MAAETAKARNEIMWFPLKEFVYFQCRQDTRRHQAIVFSPMKSITKLGHGNWHLSIV
jgi:hypothetical protein